MGETCPRNSCIGLEFKELFRVVFIVKGYSQLCPSILSFLFKEAHKQILHTNFQD